MVCGHSLELNSRNDIDFYISTSQMKLGYSCLTSNLKMSSENPKQEVKTEDTTDEKFEFEPTNQKASISSDIPVDVLLTAGRISVVLYSDDLHFNLQLHNPRNKNLHRESHHHSNSTLDSAVYEERSSKQRDLIPLILLQFSQPHSVLSLSPATQKLELSCYDVAFKGSTYKSCRNSLPDICDFNTDLLVTKPGHPDEQTGISPCLYTFRATDFIKQPAKVYLTLERAMKININCSEVEKMMRIVQILQMECFQSLSQAGVPLDENVEKEPVNSGGGSVLKYLELIHELDISTKQICVALDASCKQTSNPLSVMWSLSELEANVAVSQAHGKADINSSVDI